MPDHAESRRSFVKSSVATAVAAAVSTAQAQQNTASTKPGTPPNIILYRSGQFRATLSLEAERQGGSSGVFTGYRDKAATRP
jgi:hypothetical protein